MACKITKLSVAYDWDSCRERIVEFEKECEPNPWNTWFNLNLIFRKHYPGNTFWLVEISSGQTKKLIAAGIWRETISKRKFLKIKVLRTADVVAMRLPPFLMQKDHEEEACKMMVNALPEIARETGAHLMSLYQQYGMPMERWCNELFRRKVLFSKKILTYNPQIISPCNIDELITSRAKSRIRKIEISVRKLIKDKGDEPVYQHFTGSFNSQPELKEMWIDFQNIWHNSWQWSYLKEQDEKVFTATKEQLEETIDYLSRMGWLDISLLKINDIGIVGYICAVIDDRVWMVFSSYRKDYKKYAPGVNLFRKLQKDFQQQKKKVIDFGGEALDWKRKWANFEEPLLNIEYPIGGLQGKLWAFYQRFFGKKEVRIKKLHEIQSLNDYEQSKKS